MNIRKILNFISNIKCLKSKWFIGIKWIYYICNFLSTGTMSLQFIIFFFNQSNIKMKGMWEWLEIEDAIILEDNKIEEDNNKNEQSVNKLFIKGSYWHKYISLTLFITYKLHLSADQLILSEDTWWWLQIVGLLGRAALYNYLFGPEIGLLLLGLDLIDNV